MSLKQIAELTGASVSTVSRVLNHPNYVGSNPKLAEQIWETARKLKYVPNSYARDLRRGTQTEEIPYTVDIFLTRFQSLDEDAFFAELYQNVKEEILNAGCLLGETFNTVNLMGLFDLKNDSAGIIPYKPADKETVAGQLPYLHAKKNSGLIVLGKCPREWIAPLKKRYSCIAGIDRNPTDHEYDEVVCNGMTAAEKAIEYLISLGHTNIAYIGDCTYESRYIGYYRSLINHKIALNHGNIYPTNQTEQEGMAVMEKILASANRPTAIFCANDSTALGVLGALRKNRKRGYLPSVISIDNIREAQKVSPMLTTIDIPKRDMAHLALVILLDRKNGAHTENVRMELPCRLIVRESCNYVS